MAEIIAITNQKGGVGKTTTALNLGAGLRRKGFRVLMVDMDPQCSLSYAMNGLGAGLTVFDLMTGSGSARQAVRKTASGDLIASSPSLSGMDLVLTQSGKEYRLRDALLPIGAEYDYVVVDSPPTLGVLTVNILAASGGVIIPALADIFSLQGVGQLYATIEAVRLHCNPDLRILGILLNRHTERYVLSREMREMLEDTAAHLGTRVFHTAIREAVGLREAQARQQSIFEYAHRSRQAADYEAFVGELLAASPAPSAR
ncbi:MAG: ParA family protein [Clostridia bacterium]|nr:ParA family protein [Clostridia bacterium]